MVAVQKVDKYEVKVFLENLKRSGVNSIYEVACRVSDEFGLSLSEANDEVFNWIKTYDESEYRICKICGSAMSYGFCIADGHAYYCSETCLNVDMTDEEYEELYEADSAYFTEWYE